MTHSRIASRLTAGLALALAPLAFAAGGCSSAGEPEGNTTSSVTTRRPVAIMPWRAPASDGMRAATVTATSAHLTYYGGRVVSNMQVVQVLWGGTSSQYLSNVWNTSSPSMATFYQGVLNSSYVDWLTEYNTTGHSPGSNQAIGRGSFAGQYHITPSTSATTVDDSTIQSELQSQINAGHLPAPTTDSAGNNNTYYAIFFPHGTTITQGGSSSCVSGGFCAYHGTVSTSGREFYYGVHPDMQSGSGCDTGCGSSTPFGNYTSVASHEMVETITDCEVGIATANAAPLAWYDSTNGEIGDICNAQQATVTGSDGVSYTVQKEWSNSQNNCIATNGTAPANDFSVTLTPTSETVAAGSSTTVTVKTAITAGSAETVNLSVTGLPSGVTGSFNPTSVTSGGSSTLTLTAASSAPSATASLTITGSASSGSHSVTDTLTVNGTTPPPGGITNGDFETGTLSGWTSTGSASISSTAHGGTHSAMVGSTSPSTDSSIAQTFTVPSGDTQLSFYYRVVCPDTIAYDWATATLKDNTAGTTTTVLAKTCTNNGTWSQVTAAVTAGHSYTLTLSNHDDNYAGDATYTYYDDVTFGGSAPPPPPPPNGIANGGFETGDFTGWTPGGAAHSVTTAAKHSGTYGATLGSSSPTNGDSNVSQTFTAPSGTTKLSFYYGVTCPDTVTYDWATATLKDNTTGTSTTILAKTCAASSAWTQVSAGITAGHSYTLTLVSHDDNYSGDATYTYYDDVVTQ